MDNIACLGIPYIAPKVFYFFWKHFISVDDNIFPVALPQISIAFEIEDIIFNWSVKIYRLVFFVLNWTFSDDKNGEFDNQYIFFYFYVYSLW